MTIWLNTRGGVLLFIYLNGPNFGAAIKVIPIVAKKFQPVAYMSINCCDERMMMSKLERVLAPNSIDMPDCRCGTEMLLMRTTENSPDTEVRVYECPSCRHMLTLMAWKGSIVNAAKVRVSDL